MERVGAGDLYGKTIDCHSHVGMSLKAYARMEYPYGQSVEDLRYKQMAAGVDVNVVFPASGSLFFDPLGFESGEMRPCARPLSPAPYAIENEMMMREVFRFNHRDRRRFIPFVSADPGRMVEEQLRAIRALEESYPVYGVKISPVECQSKVTELLGPGGAILDYAEERGIPVLLHTTVDPEEAYSHVEPTLRVVESRPGVRFCLAHCMGFHRRFLERADAASNAWVDTAALKIQVQCARENSRIMASEADRLPADYSDHTRVMLALMEAYPETIVWGTDSPWYAFFSIRRQSADSVLEFRLEGRYEDEVAALNSLPAPLRAGACNGNTLRFLFGDA